MRLEAQMVGGFYPAPPEAIDMVLGYLHGQPGATILDPCAGKGEAIGQLAAGLGLDAGQVYAIELEQSRSALTHARLAGSHVLAPADFHQTDITAASMSLVWCNPPFDDEIGGGMRVEYGFFTRAIKALATNGIMCLVVPEGTMAGWEMRELAMSWLQDIRVLPFPPGYRNYREVVLVGTKRSRALEKVYTGDWMSTVARTTKERYTLPVVGHPRRFVKTGLTDQEVLEAMAASPLNAMFDEVRVSEMPSPPLELGRGQLALVLAGGLLNTTLQKPGESPILIKATPFKEEYVSSQEEEVKNEGTEKEDLVTTIVTSERIKLKVRVMDNTGTIHELS